MTKSLDSAWPYPDPVIRTEEGLPPRWTCPEGICTCEAPRGRTGLRTHWLVLFDHCGIRMPSARCRLHWGGRLVTAVADRAGNVRVELPSDGRLVFVEWAPAGLPQGPRFPYQLRYFLEVGGPYPEEYARRLNNLGFESSPVEEQVRAFQRVYELPVTGVPEHVTERLRRYYDEVQLDPVPPAKPAGSEAHFNHIHAQLGKTR